MSVLGPAASVADYYRWHARIYDATRWAFLFGRSRLVRMAARRRPRRILEIGCGTGRNLAALAKAFPEAEIVGVDLSEEMLKIARGKTAAYGERVLLARGAYVAPMAEGTPFDLIVFSYCLSMINPGYAEVLALCERDLSESGRIAIVDFHDTRFGWFRQWMGLNHVRFDGQILRAIERQGLQVEERTLQPAYGGLWRWLLCVAERRTG